MKRALSLLTCLALSCGSCLSSVIVDEDAFGTSLGGWRKNNKNTAEYSLSGAIYRTYRPEISKTPEGGIFVSIRIDHVRGWLSSDDHAILEITIGPKGTIDSAKSNIAIQGKSITSDVIVGVSQAGQAVTNANQAVQVGTDLVADLTAKLLRENIVEAGRVSFPAALRHNYNLLYQALRVDGIALGSHTTPAAQLSVATTPGPASTTPEETPASSTASTPTTTPDPNTPTTPATDPSKPAETPAIPTSGDKPSQQETPPAAIPVLEQPPLEAAPKSKHEKPGTRTEETRTHPEHPGSPKS